MPILQDNFTRKRFVVRRNPYCLLDLVHKQLPRSDTLNVKEVMKVLAERQLIAINKALYDRIKNGKLVE